MIPSGVETPSGVKSIANVPNWKCSEQCTRSSLLNLFLQSTPSSLYLGLRLPFGFHFQSSCMFNHPALAYRTSHNKHNGTHTQNMKYKVLDSESCISSYVGRWYLKRQKCSKVTTTITPATTLETVFSIGPFFLKFRKSIKLKSPKTHF